MYIQWFVILETNLNEGRETNLIYSNNKKPTNKRLGPWRNYLNNRRSVEGFPWTNVHHTNEQPRLHREVAVNLFESACAACRNPAPRIGLWTSQQQVSFVFFYFLYFFTDEITVPSATFGLSNHDWARLYQSPFM